MRTKRFELKGWTRTVRRGTVVVGLPWWKIITTGLLLFAIVVGGAYLTGCTCTGFKQQTHDQVDAAIKSLEFSLTRAQEGRADEPARVQTTINNLKVAKTNIERNMEEE